jgi:hypothetical protein
MAGAGTTRGARETKLRMTAACWLQSPLPAGHRTKRGAAHEGCVWRLCWCADRRAVTRLENRQTAQSRGRSSGSPGSRRRSI